MATIEIDFDVFKALTARRASEATTYNEVIRDLLGIGAPTTALAQPGVAGCVYLGVLFPEGTQFQVTYKGRTHTAEIRDGVWVGRDGVKRKSPSNAATAITRTNVNGWRFWKCRMPGETNWRLMDELHP